MRTQTSGNPETRENNSKLSNFRMTFWIIFRLLFSAVWKGNWVADMD